MKRRAVQVNRSDYPEALSEFFKDAHVYDSSCSQEAQVLFIDKDGGYYAKKAMKGTLKTESLMTQYMHSLGLSAEVLYYGSFEDSDFLLTGRIPGEDCTDSKYLSEPERLCDTTAMLLRTLHETEGSKCPVQDRMRTYAETAEWETGISISFGVYGHSSSISEQTSIQADSWMLMGRK